MKVGSMEERKLKKGELNVSLRLIPIVVWQKPTKHCENLNKAKKMKNQLSSVTHSYLTLCNPRDCSAPGFLVHYQLLRLAQTHVHRVGDAIQPSHPLLSPSSPAFSLSQHQGLFQ